VTTRVVLASRNAHKVEEMDRILADAGLHVDVVGIGAFDGVAEIPEVPETEATFEATRCSRPAPCAPPPV